MFLVIRVIYVEGEPLMLIESPRWTSSRIGPTFVIVAEKPLPPDTEVSRGIKEDIVPMCST
jgi:hypothetical protein